MLVTAFTRSVVPAHGFALACQLDKGLAPDVDYMALRRQEDRDAADILRFSAVHWLDLLEAPHRGYGSARPCSAVDEQDSVRIALAASLMRCRRNSGRTWSWRRRGWATTWTTSRLRRPRSPASSGTGSPSTATRLMRSASRTPCRCAIVPAAGPRRSGSARRSTGRSRPPRPTPARSASSSAELRRCPRRCAASPCSEGDGVAGRAVHGRQSAPLAPPGRLTRRRRFILWLRGAIGDTWRLPRLGHASDTLLGRSSRRIPALHARIL